MDFFKGIAGSPVVRRIVVLVATAAVTYLASLGVPEFILPEGTELAAYVFNLLLADSATEKLEATARKLKRRRLENQAGILR